MILEADLDPCALCMNAATVFGKDCCEIVSYLSLIFIALINFFEADCRSSSTPWKIIQSTMPFFISDAADLSRNNKNIRPVFHDTENFFAISKKNLSHVWKSLIM